MSKIKESNIFPVNYSALEYMSWFLADSQNIQNIQNMSCTIFRGGYTYDDPDFQLLLTAANKSVLELEDDIAKIKAFLASYIPPNNN